MSESNARFLFGSAPDSWGVWFPSDPKQTPWQRFLDEIVVAGRQDGALSHKLLLGSFVPVKMTDPGAGKAAIERIRKVGDLLAALKAPFLVLADDQSPERVAFSGRANDKDCPKLSAEQWKHVGRIVADAEKVANEFGLDLVFHPHVATYVETPEECELFYDAASHTNVGLCLDTGHCVYGYGDSVKEAEKYKSKLRLVHIKDCDTKVLEEARRNKWAFEEAIEHKVFTIIGKGNIDFPAFFRTLVKNGYSGWSVVEQDVKFGATAIPPAESVAASLKYLKGVVKDLAVSAGR